jgi:FkbM family methyltransferase
MRIMMLGTYPIDQPVHGGQRRVAQIVNMYRNAGAAVRYLSVFTDRSYGDQPETPDNFRARFSKINWLRPDDYVEDIFSGLFAATDPACIQWLMNHFVDFQPTHIQCEQPYMYPVVRMLQKRRFRNYSTIYSSQNVEAPLKRDILEAKGTDQINVDRAVRYLDKLEHTLVVNSDLVVACSSADAQTYRAMGAKRIVVCRNGAEPLKSPERQGNAIDRYMLTMGSGHPPNGSGFVQMMLGPALMFLPPRRALAVAGHMVSLVHADPDFDRYRESNMRRVSFHVPISDPDLDKLKEDSHGFFLPITSGGGCNLKTAEAIISGKWVIATSKAFRGFEELAKEPGILIEDDPKKFRRSIRDILACPPLELDHSSLEVRRQVHWSNTLSPLRKWIEETAQSAEGDETLLTASNVVRAYQTVLNREPESDEIISEHIRNFDSIWPLLEMILRSEEFLSRPLSIPSAQYRSTVDASAIFRRHGLAAPQGRPGFITDFVGSTTNTRFVNGLDRLGGCVEGPPSPHNFHGSECEWVASLRAVELAEGPHFVAIELGAGWAPWSVSCGLAAKRLAHISSVFCCGVEADQDHHGFMLEHFGSNGFLPSEYDAIHAAVGAEDGYAVFPQVPDPSADWGARPIFLPDRQQAETLAAGPVRDYRGATFDRCVIVRSLSINAILARYPRVDLLHVDIQGDEFDVLSNADDALLNRVSYLVIGTHSRPIEGKLIEHLNARGWTLEFEQPCAFALEGSELPVRVDGCQGWRRSDLSNRAPA